MPDSGYPHSKNRVAGHHARWLTVVHCKLFHAFGSGTWYLTEYDGKDMAFGYVTGFTADEWGYVTISELEALHLCGGVPRVECDLHFDPICFSKLRVQEQV